MNLSTTKIPSYFNCNVKVKYEDLSPYGEVGNYDDKGNVITLCTVLEKDYPFHRQIVYLHEMFHATGGSRVSFRLNRLHTTFKRKFLRVEECIAEICTMVAMKKMGIFNKYSKVIPEEGIKTNYDHDIYIPWNEVVTAMYKYSVEGADFSQELSQMRQYLIDNFQMNIKDRYDWSSN